MRVLFIQNSFGVVVVVVLVTYFRDDEVRVTFRFINQRDKHNYARKQEAMGGHHMAVASDRGAVSQISCPFSSSRKTRGAERNGSPPTDLRRR